MYVSATSFPEGIPDAFDRLSSHLPPTSPRTLFGISRGDGEVGVVYKAAAEVTYPGEARNYGLPTYTIRKGNYATELVTDYKSNTAVINDVFQQLLKSPDLDPNGYCLEWYRNEKDVLCMVKLKDEA